MKSRQLVPYRNGTLLYVLRPPNIILQYLQLHLCLDFITNLVGKLFGHVLLLPLNGFTFVFGFHHFVGHVVHLLGVMGYLQLVPITLSYFLVNLSLKFQYFVLF